MISLYELILSDVEFNETGNTQVCCPFPHLDANGNEHYDTRPSAGIDIENGGFHCFQCHRAFNELGFASEMLGITYQQANELKTIFSKPRSLTVEGWKDTGVFNLKMNQDVQDKLNKIGLTKSTIEELNIGTIKENSIDIPVVMFNHIVDMVRYRPGENPKTIREFGSPSGMIIPFDNWRYSPKTKATLVCAGEKDMAIAREYGFNAITITGGEGTIPKLFKSFFKDRNTYIIYDNDEAGRIGAQKVAMALKPYTSKLKIVDLSDVCIEKGEDLWDYFKKYNKSREDLVQLIKDSKEFTEDDLKIIKEKEYPTVSLLEAGTPKYVNKLVRSDIQVIGIYEDQFQIPTVLEAKKMKSSEDPIGNTLPLHTTLNWFLEDKNLVDILSLMDSKLRQKQIDEFKGATLLKIPPREKHMMLREISKETVHKCNVADIIANEDDMLNAKPRTEVLAYSIGKRLESGKKYKITYKLVPHPLDGQKLTMIILDAETSEDETNSFKLNEDTKNTLKLFQTKDLTLHQKVDDNLERVRGMVQAEYNKKLIFLVDLYFHSVLFFDLGRQKNVKGALDILLVGESRTGKSSTAETLAQWYGKGHKVSLITTTKTALTGGTQKTSGGSNQTRAGIIPMNHGGALILEELGKSRDQDLLKELTEIKSSGITRIGRVSGTLELPSVVRFLAITNPKTIGNSPKPISAYPNGISIVTDLVGTAEDIARFDLTAVFSDMASGDINPFATFKEPYTKDQYRTRINWVWSRKPDQIIITEDVFKHLIDVSNRLKNTYNSHIKIFGTETWKKLSRFAIALAGYVASSDETFENIIVKTEHIDYASEFIVSMYDNDVFRLKEYVEEERRYRDINEEGLTTLKDLFRTNSGVVEELEKSSETTRANLESIAGSMSREDLNKFITQLRINAFIRLEGFNIIPTERFRKGMKQIDPETRKQIIGRMLEPGAITL